MSDIEVDVNGLSDAVKKLLDQYGDQVSLAVRNAVPTVAKQAAKKLRGHKNFSEKGKPSKYYAKDWTATAEYQHVTVSSSIYNKKHYQLTHLLENGHAKRNGGRVQAYPHIKEVEEWAKKEVVDRIEKEIQK